MGICQLSFFCYLVKLDCLGEVLKSILLKVIYLLIFPEDETDGKLDVTDLDDEELDMVLFLCSY